MIKLSDFTNISSDENGYSIGNCKVCNEKGVLIINHKHTVPDPIPMDADWWTENDIFVFGSNDLGKHAGGAAHAAVLKYGAIIGQPRYMQGNSYGIVTISFTGDENINLNSIENELDSFIEFAKTHTNLRFWMTKIGTGISGYSIDEIAEIFFRKEFPDNVILPIEFIK